MTNEVEGDESPKVKPVDADELSEIRDALSQQFGRYLQPGESMTIDAERDEEKCWARVVLATADDSFQLELEAVSLPGDDDGKWDPVARFDDVIDLLDANLDEYFEEERHHFFHDDWRLYTFENATLRFRGAETRPDIDALADAWLEREGQDPGEGT